MSEAAATILVVDDNETNLNMLSRRLERQGHQVTTAAGGRQALTLIEDQAYDMVLLDLMMPGIDGLEVLKTVRRTHPPSALPIIMVTAKHDSQDIIDALQLGANDYVTKPIDYPVLSARMATQLARKRAEQALKELNQSLEQRVGEQATELREAESQLMGISRNLPGIIFRMVRNTKGDIHYPFISDADHALEVCGRFVPFDSIHSEDIRRFKETMDRSAHNLTPLNIEYRVVPTPGTISWFHCKAQPQRLSCGDIAWDGMLLDITERKSLEIQLLQAQKLESIGQLAAGIAHEINTPTQYIGDNTRFLQDAFTDLLEIEQAYARLLEAAQNGPVTPGLIVEINAVLKQADLEYLKEEIPKAIEQALVGLQKIARIVRAMKEFSHPGGQDKESIDLNRIVENTLTVARNEWKYVAEVVTDFDENLPAVQCFPDELGQVFLNLIVNAAHAIADTVGDGSGGKGTINISARQIGDAVEVRISDTGTGIPAAIQEKIFDPFFTTKEVGKGTGQGLAIARSVIVDKHGGSLELESKPGQGTTFVIRLPIGDDDTLGQVATG